MPFFRITFIISSLVAVATAQAIAFGPGSGGVINRTTSNGHSTNWGEFRSEIQVNRPNMFVKNLNSVTLTGLRHPLVGSFRMYVSLPNAGRFFWLYSSGAGELAGVNGTYTLVDTPGVTTLSQRAKQGGTVPTGTYRATMEDPNDFENSLGTNWNHIDLAPVSGTWELVIENYDRNSNGAITSWSFDADITAVPEPATMLVLAVGAMALVKRRRR